MVFPPPTPLTSFPHVLSSPYPLLLFPSEKSKQPNDVMAQQVLGELSTYPHIMTGQERPVGVKGSKSRQKNQRHSHSHC